MIDCHTHLEQKDYDNDRDEVIRRCEKAGLNAIITCCSHPSDINVTKAMLDGYPNFVFATASIHPEYIAGIDEEWLKKTLSFINDLRVVGVGETGLDFKVIQTEELRKKQSDLFEKFIAVAEKSKKPLVVHARGAFREAIDLLETNCARRVVMHFFSARDQLKRVLDNDWNITVNTTLYQSKKMKKIVRDMPIERILLETDAPWLGREGMRNEPTAVKGVAEKIAEIKKCSFSEVWSLCGKNATDLFELPL